LVPVINGPVYKAILPDIRPLLPVPNFPNMTNPTQIVKPSLSVAISVKGTTHKISVVEENQAGGSVLQMTEALRVGYPLPSAVVTFGRYYRQPSIERVATHNSN
jgi:hypothetical protein